jgi:hypothetical protein
MIPFKSLEFIRQGAAALEAIMGANGVPPGAKLKKIEVLEPLGLGGLRFIMEDGSEWTARVTLSKTK